MLTRFARNATGSLGIVVPGVCYAEIFSPIVAELKRLAAAAQLKLTTCHHPLEDLAHIAFQTLLQRIKSPLLPPRTILLSAPLVVRESTGRDRARPSHVGTEVLQLP